MPCDYKNYPPNWKTEIRPRILERCKDEHGIERCEHCGIRNGAELQRIISKRERMVVVVLTIAHLNHDTTDNRDENLAALCQKCHNTYYVRHRAKNRANTLDRKRGQSTLEFE